MTDLFSNHVESNLSPFEMPKYAVISECEKFRYVLSRTWSAGPRCLFVMLNPSTADATKDDHTIRKCVEFCKRWGFCALDVVNVYAFRATDPREMKKAGYPRGPANHLYLEAYAKEASCIVLAYGRHARSLDAALAQHHLSIGAPKTEFRCLGKNKDFTPKHPLMISYDTPLEIFT